MEASTGAVMHEGKQLVKLLRKLFPLLRRNFMEVDVKPKAEEAGNLWPNHDSTAQKKRKLPHRGRVVADNGP